MTCDWRPLLIWFSAAYYHDTNSSTKSHDNDEVYTQQAGPSPADYDEELDEEQGVRGAAVLLCNAGEVRRAIP